MATKVEEKKLNKKELAKALGMSSTTLWRCLNSAKKKAKKLKLEKLPSHCFYPGGRKYYYLSEVQIWLQKVSEN
ncbi:hypothetical protein LHEJCM1005_10980 [Lactobacillus helveticus]|uniref:winged helix-turn-helix domain-containing protein n=1 Tax=Lactobacillus helveticus TaxID=1587 RepID=UPI00191BA98E|nr:winged helix-turn-helix domain-containing protein [Lactobacillus helveticus]GFP06806.1 hypothetical protein LHEJCM1005_10980 [Lactobacillus helveticus]